MDDLSRAADESFASVAEHAPAMLWRGDEHGKCIYLNKAQRAFWGVTDISTFTWSSTLLEEDAPKVFGPFSDGMAQHKPFRCEARYRRFDGETRILETHAEPCFSAGGVFTGMIGVNVDVTDQRRAQTELRESEARLRALADNLPYGMIYQIVRDESGARRFSFVSSRCKELNGVDAEEAIANPHLLHSQIIEEDRAAFAAAEEAAFAAMKPFEADARIRKTDGEVRWYRVASAPRMLADGSVVWDGVQVDIHDMKMAEERRTLLMKEMSHRIKNTLSTVLSIATQTGRHAADYSAFNRSFQARLVALSKSHDLLMKDARGTADLREILEAELLPYSCDTALGRTLTLTGEPVRLSTRAAVGLGLVVHELATNAAKYGAYSGAGAIDVSWRSNGGSMLLHWRERGGPVVSPPASTGFGSKLIDGVLRGELGGAVETRFAPLGFEADLQFQTVSVGEDA
ncbi:MAG: PAS domain S-box protein [Alphaproteobacteria bacterium]|nr:PAS domain S-box protein [Alphaproteobacteria bacterium]